MTLDELLRTVEEAADAPDFDGLGAADTLRLVAEVRRLQDAERLYRQAEREALRVIGAIVSQQEGGRMALPEEALRRDYTLERHQDVASLRVVYWARPADAP